jgi:hypothetical protein
MAEPSRRLVPKGQAPKLARYRPSYATDIRATFRRLAREQRQPGQTKEDTTR